MKQFIHEMMRFTNKHRPISSVIELMKTPRAKTHLRMVPERIIPIIKQRKVERVLVQPCLCAQDRL